jgi:hypothetical protein
VVAIRAGVAIAVLVCLGSCEAGGKGRASMTTTTTERTASTTTSSTTVDPNRGFSTDRVVIQGPTPADPRGSSLFRQLSFAGNEGYDRAVFEFEGGLPYGGFYVE